MRDVFAAILIRLEQGQPVVRVSVMKSAGSTPRAAGATMAVFKDGSMKGTIGGGSVENESHIAAKLMKPGTSEIRTFDLTANDAASLGMVCGGNMTVLLDSLLPSKETINLVQEVIKRYRSSDKHQLTTTLAANGEVLRREVQPADNDTLKSLHAPVVFPTDDGSLFVEPLIIPKTIHFIGAGHVAQATAPLAASTGFRVKVVDDRTDFANADRFPNAAEITVADSLKECLPESLGPEDYVVIMTRGHLHDKDVLAQALKTSAGYVGMIGSTKKKKAVYESLLCDGFRPQDLDRVHCPIGLSIGADTPEEIAISIMAELISIRKENRSSFKQVSQVMDK
ncbi:MAG: XdhC family protein [Proteobacteria bacterium]|nr:XdhC family protein [Pseudomonadota bacterium]